MKTILDRSFKYVSAAETDLSKTFARVRRQQRAEEETRQQIREEQATKVAPLKKAASK